MTDSSSKLLQIQGTWYQERKPKKIQNLSQKKNKNYSESIIWRYFPTFFPIFPRVWRHVVRWPVRLAPSCDPAEQNHRIFPLFLEKLSIFWRNDFYYHYIWWTWWTIYLLNHIYIYIHIRIYIYYNLIQYHICSYIHKYPAGTLPAWENDQKNEALTASSQVWAFETYQKKAPSTFGMTTLPSLQPQKAQPQLFLTFSSTLQRWLPSGFSLCTPTCTGKSACISIFEDCASGPFSIYNMQTYIHG